MSHLNNTITDTVKITPQDKILLKIDELEMALIANKKSTELALFELRSVKKQIKKLKPQKKKNKKIELDRKPHGFAVPSIVSDELCSFMNVDKGSLVSRTNVTKRLTEYISEKKLQNPENKRQIIPDAVLSSLLGEPAKDIYLTHFTIQKYMNHHFSKAGSGTVSQEANANASTQDLTKKDNKLFDDNKTKWTAEHAK
jgi:chromatin remodeling complex protein RSC6